jgi:arginyl-tRNA synthetase
MKEHLKSLINAAILQLKEQDEIADDIPITIHVERTKDKLHGDFASNIAMILAKPSGKKPRDLATLIKASIPASPIVKEITIAGPGFINFSLHSDSFLSIVPDILAAAENYGCSNIGHGLKVNLEFVSSNPTGPLHVGHGRSAAFGGSLANLLSLTGFNVHCEYYVNDAGRQMDILATSIWLRYLELFGYNIPFPSNGYQGDYVREIAQQLKTKHGDTFRVDPAQVFVDLPQDAAPDGSGDKEAHIDGLIAATKKLLGDQNYRAVFDFGTAAILADIKDDLLGFGVEYQEWFSEQSLVDSGAIARAIAKLRQGGHCYERDGATWFNSVAFGDDKDRVLIRENGQTTYFASDVAYLQNKADRGFDKLIYIVGSDHHGYIPRLKAAATALGLNPAIIQVLFVQFAVLYRGSERVQMSTRSGSFVTLRELREEVGKDAARFFYVTRKIDQHMDFDLELAKSESSDNPVYYIQYAHARICSVLRQLAEKGLTWDKEAGIQALATLTEEHENALLVDLSRYNEVVETAALTNDPQLIATFLREIANDFQSYYNAHQFLVADATLRNARLCLIMAVRQVIFNGLKILGVSAPDSM